jgi:hypothetical protein
MKSTRVRKAALIGALLLAFGVLFFWWGAVRQVRADPGILPVPTYFVAPPPVGDDTGNNCTDSNNPCATAQHAIDVAADGEIINLAGGTYAPGGTVAVIDKGLWLEGGYAPDFSVHAPDTYQTVFDAGWAGSVISVTNAGTVWLEYLTIMHGDGTGNCGSNGCGGGVYSKDTDLRVAYCQITDNVGSSTGIGQGGGLYVYNSVGHSASAQFVENRIANNTASTAGNGSGGGLFLHAANAAAPAEVSSNLFESNAGSTAGNGYGGGIFLHYYATLRDNVFHHNAGSRGSGLTGGGGALYMHYAPGVTVDQNRFFDNAASTPGEESSIFGSGTGGAIQGYSLVVFTMTNNLLVDNFATSAGGAIHLNGWKATRGITGSLSNNTIVRNDSPVGSEAIWVSQYVTLEAINNIIAGHSVGITSTVPASSTVYAYRNLYWNDLDPIVGGAPVLEDPRLSPVYYPCTDSPVIDQGIDIPWLANDLDGNPRTFGSYDIGALEGQVVCYDTYLPLILKGHSPVMTPLFFDDFNHGTLSNWTATNGTWSNPGSYMRGEDTVNAWNMHVSAGGNFVYEGTVTLVSGNAAGLVFRSSADGSSSYDVILDAQDGVFKISKRSPYQVLASYPVAVQHGRPYRIKVVAHGSMIEAYLGGKNLLKVIDATYPEGQLGVILFQSVATYDDLEAWEIP